MADHADNDLEDIFIYRGGRVPQHVTHVLIDKSVDEIEDDAFRNNRRLVQVDTHDGLKKIGKRAFYNCISLRRINLKSAVEIDQYAFYNCFNLESVEFGDRLETIGESAFAYCASLKSSLKLPSITTIEEYAFAYCGLKHLQLSSIITIGRYAFSTCESLTDIELSERLESLGASAFYGCERLQRIAVPLKRDLFVFSDRFQEYNQFKYCVQLTTVDLVGGIHETVASLHMESWRTEMIAEINRINQVLPNTSTNGKANQIRQWMDSVIEEMDHYRAEHCRYVKEGLTLLELALWKAKLGEKEDTPNFEEGRKKKAKVDAASARKERRVTCGADTVIKNVLPFLQLEE